MAPTATRSLSPSPPPPPPRFARRPVAQGVGGGQRWCWWWFYPRVGWGHPGVTGPASQAGPRGFPAFSRQKEQQGRWAQPETQAQGAELGAERGQPRPAGTLVETRVWSGCRAAGRRESASLPPPEGSSCGGTQLYPWDPVAPVCRLGGRAGSAQPPLWLSRKPRSQSSGCLPAPGPVLSLYWAPSSAQGLGDLGFWQRHPPAHAREASPLRLSWFATPTGPRAGPGLLDPWTHPCTLWSSF